MRVIIAGGGTGGHIFPAISIAEEIMNTDKKNEVLFIGTKRGMEGKLIPQRGFNIEFIRSYPILGKTIMYKLKGLLYTFIGIYESLKIFNTFRPDIVVGVGGYVSGPVVLAAFIKRIPRVICEQNSVPGMTNRVLSYLADKVFVSFEKSKTFFDDRKTMLTGNPIQSKFSSQGLTERKKSQWQKFNILILGGSQGAKKLNEVLPECLSIMDNKVIRIVHQCGENDYEDVLERYSRYNLDVSVYKFIDNIEDYYADADIVIARSGAGTLAEICSVGVASVLIPYPFATHNHQYHNALVLEQSHAAILIEESDLNAKELASQVSALLDRAKLKEMASRAKALGKPRASGAVVENMYKILNMKPCMGV